MSFYLLIHLLLYRKRQNQKDIFFDTCDKGRHDRKTNENMVLEMFEYFKIYFFMYSIANVMQFRAK